MDMFSKDRPIDPPTPPSDPAVELQRGIYSRLVEAAGQNSSEAQTLGEAKNLHTHRMMHGLGHTGNAQTALTRVLWNMAYSLSTGATRLTANIGTYHNFGSPEPTFALLGLQQIVAAAGFPCEIETQANVRVKEPSDALAELILRLGADSDGSKAFFSISGQKLEAALPELRKLEPQGVTVEFWPSIVSRGPTVPDATTLAA